MIYEGFVVGSRITPFSHPLNSAMPLGGIQQVTADEFRVGELGAKALISSGFAHFAYYGPPPREHYTDNILLAFHAGVEKAGFTLDVIDRPAVHSAPPEYNLDLPAPAAALQRLPQPVGILTWMLSLTAKASPVTSVAVEPFV